jgi:hypothetical protein
MSHILAGIGYRDVRLLVRLRKTFWPVGGSTEAEEGKDCQDDHDEADEIDDAVHLLSPLIGFCHSTGFVEFCSPACPMAFGSGPALLRCNMRAGE